METIDFRKAKFKNITRLDYPASRTRGWWVRVQSRGKRVSRYFSDTAHGGVGWALYSAIAYRATLWQDFGLPDTERHVVAPAHPLTGVRRTVKDGREVWEATWAREPNGVGRTSFSVAKHGEEGALELALEERRARERELYGAELPREGLG